MTPMLHRTARRTARSAAFAALGTVAVVLTPGLARAQSAYPDEPNQVSLQAFTPPSPGTVGTPPSVSVPTPPTPPAGTMPDAPGYAPPVVDGADPATTDGSAMIPPGVEGAAYPVSGGSGYCYVGPHPVDTRVVPGAPWDPTTGQHIRPYPPIDTRLFAYHDGCYHFTGDPRDFGYGGQTYAYYGAHPVLATYGGGWCFMMGGHAHLWAPWSPYFTVVGPWYYWQGAYDPFFWTYWPYYSHYYRSYYPHYYGGGRFSRGGHHVAPPIRAVPASAWRGMPSGQGAPITRGAAPGPMPMNRLAPPGGPMSGRPGVGPGFAPGPHGARGPAPTAPPAAGAVMGHGPGPSAPGPRPSFSPGPGSFSPGPRPSFSPGPGSSFAPGPRPSFGPAPRPFAPGPGSFSPGPRPSFSPAPRPSFSPSPGPRPSFSPGPAAGGFRGGGMGSRGPGPGGGGRH